MADINIDAQFNDIYIPHLNNYARTQIFYGGAGSGKSVFLAQRCVYDVLQGGRNYLVCRAVGRYIKKSVWMEVKRVISAWGLEELFIDRIVDGIIECSNGYQIIFTGLDDPEKLKSIVPAKGAITDVWVEEATEISKQVLTNLRKRQRGGDDVPKRLTMSFNPILQSHWIFKEYFMGWASEQTEYNSDDLTILKTWYEHNRFLTTGDVEDLLSETDKYYFEVYTLGNWGVLGNVIFTNWKVQDLSGMQDQFTNRRNGLDFGYSADPAAASCTHYDKMRKRIYIFDELYETGLTNDVLAELLKPMIGKERIVCDSAEPKSIAELRQHGINAVGAKKGKDSVLHGIQWLQQQEIIIDVKCINTQNEFQQYKWKEGRDGIPVSPPRPVGTGDHIIDGLRYAYEDDMTARMKIQTKAKITSYTRGKEEKEVRPGF
jgi:phage terminase large subunit